MVSPSVIGAMRNGYRERTASQQRRSATSAAGIDGRHRNVPQPAPECLYGLIGEIARAGSAGTEANAYAIAANLIAYLSCAVGRSVYLPIGNTWHHPRLFCLHIGRSGRGRKGDALSLVFRIDEALRAQDDSLTLQIHRGGLSSREGLVALIHDGYRQGRQEIPAVQDKRLWVVESEFANVLHQGRRDGNTLSSALRDCWDGVSLKPATKTHRLSASEPHVCLSGAISPSELTGLMCRRELTNGFANRFLMIWAERTQILPFPQATPHVQVSAWARQIKGMLDWLGSNRFPYQCTHCMTLSEPAKARYAQLYQGVLNEEPGHEVLAAMLERRAPMLLRLAMLFALTDQQMRIEVAHIDAAMAWVRYATDTVGYVFVHGAQQAQMAQTVDLAQRVLTYLEEHGPATRTQIVAECLKGKVSKERLDASLSYLLGLTPACISVQTIARRDGAPGSPTRLYAALHPG